MSFLFAILFLLLNSNTTLEGQTVPKTFKYLALGDSYTKGESVSIDKSFPFQLFSELKKKSLIKDGSVEVIAQTGWTTSSLITAVENDNGNKTYDLVTLLIGVNNQYQGKPVSLYEKEFKELLETAIAKTGNDKNKVIVISIPDYGYTPFGRGNQTNISKGIDMYNLINKRITIEKGITYIDITPISRKGLSQPELVAFDGLHPSPIMYKQWVDLIVVEAVRKVK